MHAREKADETLPYFEPSLLTDLQMYVYINSARTSWRSGSEGRSLAMLLVPNISKESGGESAEQGDQALLDDLE